MQNMSEVEEEKFKADALLFRGVNLDDEKAKSKPEETFVFKDPEEYNHLSDEEKAKVTEKMKEKLKGLSEMSSKFRMGSIKK